MQDGKAIDGIQAGEELKRLVADKPEPKVTLSWRDEEPDPVAYRRVLEILFRPRTDSPTL